MGHERLCLRVVLSYSLFSRFAAAVIARYTQASPRGAERRRREDKALCVCVFLSLSVCGKGSFLLLAFVPLFLLVSMDSKLAFRYEVYDEKYNMFWMDWGPLWRLFHHQWVVQLLLCYMVICCGRVGDGIGGDWVQSICSWVQLAFVRSWIAVLVSEIETTRGFAMLARLSKTCLFVSFNPFLELSNSCWWWKLTSSNGRC